MTLSEELQWRGLIKDRTFQDLSWIDRPQSFYLGIDASADSLTVGNLAIILLVRRLAKAGWQAFLVMGGGTSLVGDPGGKTEERQLMSRETVQHNIERVRQQVTDLFKGEHFSLVDNHDWLANLNYLEFLRDVGKHFSMTELMQRDFVTERMGEGGAGISYAEFSYSLVQGYDFWHLCKEHGVVMQIGGSDQWGNLLSGVALIRKKENKEAHALSMPLVINRATGKKFGKSEEGAVWLDPAKTSVYKFYQFWLNVDDEGVEDYLKIYTELDRPVIEALMSEFSANKAGRAAQKRLAFEVTKLVHGEVHAEQQKRLAEILTGTGDYHELTTGDFAILAEELPVATLPRSMALEALVEALVSTQLATSKTEARRLLADGAIYVNNDKFSQAGDRVLFDTAAGCGVIRRGKALKDSALIKFES